MCTSTPEMGCQNVYRPHLVVIMAMLASTGAGLHSQAFRLEALVALAGNSLRVVLRVAEQTSSRKRSLAPGHLTASSALQSVWSYQTVMKWTLKCLRVGASLACVRACFAHACQSPAQLSVAGSKGCIRGEQVQTHHCKAWITTNAK
jgi:hypothetical protein